MDPIIVQANGDTIRCHSPILQSFREVPAIAGVMVAWKPGFHFLDNDGLNKGNILIAGNEGVYAELSEINNRYLK